MLNFEHKPDVIFTEILTNSIDLTIENLSAEDGEDLLEISYPQIAEVFSLEAALKTLERLSFCHQSPGVYSFNDFHRVLIYDALYFYCEAMSCNGFEIIKGTKIDEINFEQVKEYYLPELDCCASCLAKAGEPSERELECKLLRENHVAFSSDKDEVSLFNPESTKYPDPQYSEAYRKAE